MGQHSVVAWGSTVWWHGAAQCCHMCGGMQHSVAWGSAVWLGQHRAAWGSTVWHVAAQCGSMGQHSVAWGSTVWHGAAQCGMCTMAHRGQATSTRAGHVPVYGMGWGMYTVTQVADKEHQSRACACLGMGCGMYTGHTEARRGATEQDMYTKLCTLHCTLHLQCRVDFLRMPDAPIAPAN